MKRSWNSIAVIHEPERQLKHCIMSSRMGGWSQFELLLLNNGNVVAQGMVYDGLIADEYDDIDEAFAQYNEWVRAQQEQEIAFTKAHYLKDKS